MADLQRLRDDLGYFSHAVGRPLAPWQLASLALEQRVTCVVGPRQSGKSRALSVLALHRAYAVAGLFVLVLSSGEVGARRLLREIRNIAASSPLLRGSVVDESTSSLRLSNGSQIVSVPQSEFQVRGWTVDLLLVDEAAVVNDDLLLNAAFPTTAARPQARIVLAGSAGQAVGAFYDHAVRGEQGSGHVRTFRWLLADADWISPSAIEAARESMSGLRFAMEYEGVFAGSSDSWISKGLLDSCVADTRLWALSELQGPALLAGGIDWAGQGPDRHALVALARLPEVGANVFGVVCCQVWPAATPMHLVAREVVESPAAWRRFSSERNGVGEGAGQILWREWTRQDALRGVRRRGGTRVLTPGELDAVLVGGSPIAQQSGWRRPVGATRVDVFTSAPLKASMFTALRVMLERRQLVIPAAAEDLYRAMLAARVSITRSGDERVDAARDEGGHSDALSALVMALQPFRRGDGQWRSWIGDMADPGGPAVLPSMSGLAGRAPRTVLSGGGLAVPVVPVLQSVSGTELSETLDVDERLLDLRNVVSMALEGAGKELVA